MTEEGSLRTARGLLARGEWEPARQALAAALAEHESPDALEGMGTALWWQGRIRESLGHRERAYAGYLAAGRHAAAAMVAVDVSVTYLTNLDSPAAAQGWIARARRATALSGDGRLAGWVWLMEGYTSDEPQVRRDLLGRALGRAREEGDVDLELAALADLGLAMVLDGEVRSGFALLDEAMAGTLGGECDRLDTVVWTSCSMLLACSLVGDQRRAAQWCAAALRFSATYGCPFLQASCRSHYGRVLIGTGDWELAEAELGRALAMADDCGRGPRVEALAGLAELRLRQGAVVEAERLLADVGSANEGVVVSAEVMTASGHPQRAVALLRVELGSTVGPELRRPRLAAGLVDAHLAAGDVGSAAAIAAALEAMTGHDHPQAAAMTHRASGRVLASSGEPGRAGDLLRAAAGEYD
ncbi:MAG: helix-turn-helix transcriptional regulator, partial [Nocardioidaceae bacterium]